MKLVINEIFGPTIQGEGPHLGQPCMFLRTGGCNLRCGFCDTKYTWDWSQYDPREELHSTPLEDIVAQLNAQPFVRHLVISGGEPMLQQNNLRHLTGLLHQTGWTTEMETAGTIAPLYPDLVNHYNISPKLENSGNPLNRRYRPDVLERLQKLPSKCFKFVVTALSDFDEIDRLVQTHSLSPVYIMPEGTNDDTLKERSQAITSAVIERGYWLTTRLHITLFGNKRAV